MASDKLLDEQKSKHGLPGVYNGADDVREHMKLNASLPRKRDVLEVARKIPGVKVKERPDGRFKVTTRSLEAKRRLSALFDDFRHRNVDRLAHVRSRRDRMRVRGVNDRVVTIDADNERQLSRAGVLKPMRLMSMPPNPTPAGDWCEDCGHRMSWCSCAPGED